MFQTVIYFLLVFFRDSFLIVKVFRNLLFSFIKDFVLVLWLVIFIKHISYKMEVEFNRLAILDNDSEDEGHCCCETSHCSEYITDIGQLAEGIENLWRRIYLQNIVVVALFVVLLCHIDRIVCVLLRTQRPE